MYTKRNRIMKLCEVSQKDAALYGKNTLAMSNHALKNQR